MDEQTITETTTSEGIDKSALAKLITAAVLSVLFITFAVQNSAGVDVDFLSWTFELRLIIVILASALVGIVIWEFLGLLRRRRKAKP